MGEIRIVGPGKKRGYPYRVCKKKQYKLNRVFAIIMQLTMMIQRKPKYSTRFSSLNVNLMMRQPFCLMLYILYTGH